MKRSFTLIELAAGMIVVGAILSIAAVSMGKAFESYEFDTSSKELWSYLNTARRNSLYFQETIDQGTRETVLYGIEFISENQYMPCSYVPEKTAIPAKFILNRELESEPVDLGSYSEIIFSGNYMRSAYKSRILFSPRGRPVTGNIDGSGNLEPVPGGLDRIAIYSITRDSTKEIEINPVTGSITLDDGD